MLVRTRAVISLAQPRSKASPEYGELYMFRNFCLHVKHELEAVLRERAARDAAPTAAAEQSTMPDAPTDSSTPTSTSSTAAPINNTSPGAPTTLDLPTDVAARYIPARWLLLSCYEAMHGEGCLLSSLRPGVTVRTERRAALMIALFIRLTGAKALLPPMRRASDAANALYDEAVVIFRRIGELGKLPPQVHDEDNRLRRWLLGRPDALAPKPVNPHNFVERHARHRHLEPSVPRERPRPIGRVAAFNHSAERRWVTRGEMATLPSYGGQLTMQVEQFLAG